MQLALTDLCCWGRFSDPAVNPGQLVASHGMEAHPRHQLVAQAHPAGLARNAIGCEREEPPLRPRDAGTGACHVWQIYCTSSRSNSPEQETVSTSCNTEGTKSKW